MNLLVASKKDPAGLNIAENLKEFMDFERLSKNTFIFKDNLLYLSEVDSINCEFVERGFHEFHEIEFVMFLSRHSSSKKISSLTLHTPGNFLKADFGGRDFEICHSNPVAQKLALLELLKQKKELNLDYEISLEATHHGPLTSKPTMFAEIGSTQEQWRDERASEALALAILKALEWKNHEFKRAVGVGGGHYSKKHTFIILYREFAIGHIIPKYIIKKLDEQNFEERMKKILKMVTSKNFGCDAVIMDFKGTPKRVLVREIIKSLGFDVLKTKEILR
ncbi:MAG: D-aminoacyl-tRNA deacylase [Candidatus Methanofastidiosia archaeon]